MLITTIVRTHDRPAQLKKCLNSIIECGYPEVQLILINDNTNKYHIDLDLAWDKFAMVDKFVPEKRSWPPNDYLNQAKPYIKGEYFTIIDDDDMVASPDYYKEIKNAVQTAHTKPNMIIWKTNLGTLYTKDKDTILPEDHNWGRRPVLSHFSILNMALKTELGKQIEWQNKRGGDGYYAMEFWDRFIKKNACDECFFINKILAKTQVSLSTHGKN